MTRRLNHIISGTYKAEMMMSCLAEKILLVKNRHHLTPAIAVILVGSDPISRIYVRTKLKAAAKIGVKCCSVDLSAHITNSQLLAEIDRLNHDPQISGIIVQLPLPEHLNQPLISSAIDPNKDVDGFHPLNVGYLHLNRSEGFVPCTALGCLALIKQCQQDLAGKNVVIIGRSHIVGRPLSALLLNHNCTVTLCHSYTSNLPDITCRADIVVAAIGRPQFLTVDYFNQAAIVIDVGINRPAGGDKNLVGDVDFANVCDQVKHITPVPGGVGPMTVTFLLANTVKAMLKQHNLADLDE